MKTQTLGGRHVSRTAGSTTTAFLYDGGSVLLEKQGSTTTGTYTYGNGLVRKDSETPLFDGLGSARAQTNGSGGVTSTLTTAAFGQTVASTGTTASAYGFGATSGYRNDGDAGLTHVGARYYDAQVGRFITRDTVLTERPYAYCEGDPVDAVDPSGHGLNEIVAGAIGGVAAGIFIATLPVSLPVAIIGGIFLGGAVGAVLGAGAGWIDQVTGTDPTESPQKGAIEGGIAGAVMGGIWPIMKNPRKAKEVIEEVYDWPPAPRPGGY